MTFFDKFPKFKYDMNKDGKSKFSVNILKRIAFREAIRNQSNYFRNYTIEDGETPEIVAHKFYGTTNLHWTILLLNESLNPFFEWPLSDHSLSNFVSKKYKGKAFYLGASGDNSHLHFDRDAEVYVSSRQDTAQRSIRGLVQEWDSTYKKLVLYNIPSLKEFILGDIITAKNNDGTSSTSTITRIVDMHGQAAHHFEDTNGNKLDPLGTPQDSNGHQTTVGMTGGYFETVERVANYSDTLSYSYANSLDSSATTWKVITNQNYESTTNESYRSIKILQPDYIQIVVDSLEEVIKT